MNSVNPSEECCFFQYYYGWSTERRDRAIFQLFDTGWTFVQTFNLWYRRLDEPSSGRPSLMPDMQFVYWDVLDWIKKPLSSRTLEQIQATITNRFPNRMPLQDNFAMETFDELLYC
ncbi:unnamed protein product [Soboliphyme baturini]|uniref:NOT2_3_5 domain-containing protein n=1 Tax=Soboliphyme baturini TaxID=241478 RepID=A0A183IUG9_9BILA|nr:unnamed protein product [Soboliphyme baturini]